MLNAVAEKIGWDKPAPQGVFRGLAHMKAFNSYVAAAAEVSVTGGNKIKIHRIVAATDPTYAVNPAQIERQVAGSFVYGLSALFYGRSAPSRTAASSETNFDTYNSMRIAQMPKVESIIMPTGGSGPGAASASRPSAWRRRRCSTRIFTATGKRIRSFPLKNHKLSPACKRRRSGGPNQSAPLLSLSICSTHRGSESAGAPDGCMPHPAAVPSSGRNARHAA